MEEDIMLKSFSVSNYKNFNHKVTLDFSNKRDYAFNEQCISRGLLNKVIIFGKNASGKSNLGFAVFDIVHTLMDNKICPEVEEESNFLNADSDKKEAEFAYEFVFDNMTVAYSYRKENPLSITMEKLSIYGKTVFEYVKNKGFLTNELSLVAGENLNFDYFDDGNSVFRYIANNTQQPEKSAVRRMMDFVKRMLWFRRLHDTRYIGLPRERESITKFICEREYLADFEKFMKQIAGLRYHLEGDYDEVNNHWRILEVHDNKKLDFVSCASSGTGALYLFYFWIKHLDEVSFLWIDEFDAFYHFDLARNIICYLRDFSTVQTVFTSHNTALLSNEILRPDCYFRLAEGELKSFPDATLRELREGHNLEKMYRNGEFDHEN